MNSYDVHMSSNNLWRKRYGLDLDMESLSISCVIAYEKWAARKSNRLGPSYLRFGAFEQPFDGYNFTHSIIIRYTKILQYRLTTKFQFKPFMVNLVCMMKSANCVLEMGTIISWGWWHGVTGKCHVDGLIVGRAWYLGGQSGRASNILDSRPITGHQCRDYLASGRPCVFWGGPTLPLGGAPSLHSFLLLSLSQLESPTKLGLTLEMCLWHM